MNTLKYGGFLVALCLSTATFAASPDGGSASGGSPGASTAVDQSGAASGQPAGGMPGLREGRAAKQSPTNSPADAPTGVGGNLKAVGTPRAPNEQGD